VTTKGIAETTIIKIIKIVIVEFVNWVLVLPTSSLANLPFAQAAGTPRSRGGVAGEQLASS
jgi:hypothetical protein